MVSLGNVSGAVSSYRFVFCFYFITRRDFFFRDVYFFVYYSVMWRRAILSYFLSIFSLQKSPDKASKNSAGNCYKTFARGSIFLRNMTFTNTIHMFFCNTHVYIFVRIYSNISISRRKYTWFLNCFRVFIFITTARRLTLCSFSLISFFLSFSPFHSFFLSFSYNKI